MTDRIDEIKRLLAEATPGLRGARVWLKHYGSRDGVPHGAYRAELFGPAHEDIGPSDAYLQARADADLALPLAAPELLGWAVGEIERLRGVIEYLETPRQCAPLDEVNP